MFHFVTVLARGESRAEIRILKGHDSAYTQQRITDDAQRLADTLQATLPMTTFFLLARMLEAKANVIEQRLEGVKEP